MYYSVQLLLQIPLQIDMSRCNRCNNATIFPDMWFQIQVHNNNTDVIRELTHDLIDIIMSEHKDKDRLMDDYSVCNMNHINITFIENPGRYDYLNLKLSNHMNNIACVNAIFKRYNMFKEFSLMSGRSPRDTLGFFSKIDVYSLVPKEHDTITESELHSRVDKVRIVDAIPSSSFQSFEY